MTTDIQVQLCVSVQNIHTFLIHVHFILRCICIFVISCVIQMYINVFSLRIYFKTMLTL